MARYTFLVLTNATGDRHDEFNEWYNNRHLPDVLAVEGFVAAQRFRLAELDPPQESAHRYMALYEVEADDLAKANQALMNTAGTDAMVLSPALDMDSASAIYFEPITERVVASE
jgi:hypothetical protein